MTTRRSTIILSALFSFLIVSMLAVANTPSRYSEPRPVADAMASLPPSDVVAYIDANRAMTEALALLSTANPKLFAEVNAKIDGFIKTSGIDVRTIDRVIVGGRFVSKNEIKAVVLLTGRFDASELIRLGLEAAKGLGMTELTNEDYKGKTLIVAPRPKEMGAASDDAEKRKANSLAIVALDANTIAAGDLESVKAAIDSATGGARVDDELVRLATSTPNALAGFSARMSREMIDSFAKDPDPMIQQAAGIRQVFGSVAMTGAMMEALIALKTETAAQAHDLAGIGNGFKDLANVASILGSSPKNMKTLDRILNAITITDQDNEVHVRVNVSRTTITKAISEATATQKKVVVRRKRK